jgi:hypothetical protein
MKHALSWIALTRYPVGDLGVGKVSTKLLDSTKQLSTYPDAKKDASQAFETARNIYDGLLLAAADEGGCAHPCQTIHTNFSRPKR